MGTTCYADSSNPRADLGDAETLHGGLSALGRAAVVELNRLGMLVDISHVSQAGGDAGGDAVQDARAGDAFVRAGAVRRAAQCGRR